LYALAERQQLANISLQGPDRRQTSITRAYMAAMMLGCCKPNQLRQADLALAYRALQLWSAMLELNHVGPGEALFLVDPQQDQPPLYSALFRNQGGPRQGGPQCHQIDTSGLVTYLEQLRALDNEQGRPGISLGEDARLPSGLLSHLIDALGSMSVRNFTRKAMEGPLSVSLGLRCAHYHAAEDVSFARLLDGSVFTRESAGTNPKYAPSHQTQLAAQAATAILHVEPELPEERDYPAYEVDAINASPGGYCLAWNRDLPAEARTGEIVSVQEGNNGIWVLAVIRWISQLANRRTLMGLELLSPRVMAYGAITQQKTGIQSAPQRVLLLPEIQLVGQPHTLVTPRVGFRERQKITLLRKGEKLSVQLQRQVAGSGSYSQFDFRYIQPLEDVVAEDKGGPLQAAYDSVWSNI